MTATAPNAVNPFAALAKFAAPAAAAFPTPDEQMAAQGAREVGQIGLAGLGVGAGLAGLRGLYNLVRRRAGSPPRRRYPAAITTDVPVPVEVADKAAADGTTATTKAAHSSTMTLPWYGAAATGAGALGLYGGWKGVDAVFSAQKEHEKQRQLEDAKRDFEQALVSTYPSPRPAGSLPMTDGEKLGAALDALYDAVCQKRAWDWNDIPGGLASGYGAYALATGAPAAMWAYNKTESGSRRNVLNKAMKLRDRRNYLSRPPEVYAVPRAVPATTTVPEEEEVAA